MGKTSFPRSNFYLARSIDVRWLASGSPPSTIHGESRRSESARPSRAWLLCSFHDRAADP